MDFMSDVLYDGRKFRTFNVIDDYNREALMIMPSHTLPATRITHLLDELACERRYPEIIRVDNGPEFASTTFRKWAAENNVVIHYIQPGKPAQNGYVERFNRTYREDILDMNMFQTLKEVRQITQSWIEVYNQQRPHESLAGLAPLEFAKRREEKLNTENSTFKSF